MLTWIGIWASRIAPFVILNDLWKDPLELSRLLELTLMVSRNCNTVKTAVLNLSHVWMKAWVHKKSGMEVVKALDLDNVLPSR